jgi:RNA polymerase sigma-70 factor (ECF subfamily)
VEEPSDADVIGASLTDTVAFGAIFDRHATVLLRYLVRRLGPDEGDTMLGDVFRIAFEKRHTYDLERDSARPWLYGIATNLVAKHRRREGRRLRAVARLAGRQPRSGDGAGSGDDDGVGEGVVDAVDAADRWRRVAEAVTALPERERDVLVLHVWEELPYAEIAAALDVPIGTVRSRLNRARRRLRELDGPSGGRQGDNDTHVRPPGRIGS